MAFGFTGGVASINTEDTPPWAQLSTEDKDHVKRQNTTIGPDVLNAVKSGTSIESFFKDWIREDSNVAPFAAALENVNCQLPAAYASTGPNGLRQLTKDFFKDKVNARAYPELMNGVR